MQKPYHTVRARFLRADERPFSSETPETPFVIEPLRFSDGAFLSDFLSWESEQIICDLATYGALLLRGFQIDSMNEFERQILAIRGMDAIDEVLMSEPGRTLVEGTRCVFHTNTLIKTGGTLSFGGFHTENYYVADVPGVISFFCLKPSWQGGETGLLNTARLYSALPDALKQALEAKAFSVSRESLVSIANRYDLMLPEIEEFCIKHDLSVVDHETGKQMVLYKPSVLVHPVTGERSLAINFTGELGRVGFVPILREAFLSDYSGMRWAIHRASWRHPGLVQAGENLRTIILRPKVALPILVKQWLAWLRKSQTIAPKAQEAETIGSIFTETDVRLVARLMRRYYSAFRWEKGDILIIDNLKMAHAGMPGFGRRNLKVIISNRINMPCSSNGGGVYAPATNERSESFGAKLRTLEKRRKLNCRE
jgi:alpha-ketoglutarate-dependent taurine dioxygenase